MSVARAEFGVSCVCGESLPRKIAQISNVNMFGDLDFELCDKWLCISNDSAVNNMNQHNDELLSCSSKEHCLVHFTL